MLLLDKVNSRYFPFDPAINLNEDSWMAANLGYLFVINKTHITSHHKNFHHVEIAN